MSYLTRGSFLNGPRGSWIFQVYYCWNVIPRSVYRLASLLQRPMRQPRTELRMEELRASFSVDSYSQCGPGFLVFSTATTGVSLAQGKELRLWGQRLWVEAQSSHWLAVVKVQFLHTLYACGTGNFKQEIHFFFFWGWVPLDRGDPAKLIQLEDSLQTPVLHGSFLSQGLYLFPWLLGSQ